MPEERITWTPANGLNVEDPPIRVRADQCVEARNMLFERGVARTRPYAVRHHFGMWPNPSPAKWRFARGMLVGADNPNSVVILTDGTLAKGPQAQALTQSGGGSFALGDTEFDNINVVNGVFVIGNNAANGMVRHDPSGSAFTIVSDAPYRYFTGLYSRAIGAISSTVGWSIAGDETNWTGAGSGTTVLAETPDEITGLRTIQNIVVVLRSMGLTAGFATGDGLSPIRWETVIREGAEGNPYPSTVGNHGNHIFYVGHDDVYHLDLNLMPQGIGEGVRREILFWLARGVLFRGFVVRMDYGLPSGGRQFISSNEMSDPKPRMRYHLVPIQRPGVPHYSYDIVSRTWGRHVYEYSFLGGLEGFNVAGSTAGVSAVSWNTMLLFDESIDHMLRWADGSSGAGEVLDKGAYIKSGVFVVGDPTHEYKVLRAHIIWARDGSHGTSDPDPPAVELKVRCKQQQRYVEQSATIELFQVAEGAEDWQTTFIDLDGKPVGQLFQISLEIPPRFPMMIAQIQLKLEDAGESKAGHFKQAA